MPEAQKKKTGRPRKEPDFEEFCRLAVLCPTYEEIAAYFSISLATIKRLMKHKKWRDALDAGKENRRTSLKRAQFRVATKRENTAMLIWLGKQELGQSDKQEQKISFDFSNMSDEDLLRFASLFLDDRG